MKRTLAALAVLGFLATPALAAQSKLEEAIAKADKELAKGKPESAENAVKKLRKAAEEAGAEGQVAMGRLQERIGDLNAAAAAYEEARATASGASKADVLAAVVNFTLRRGKAAEALVLAKQAVEAGATAASLAALARAQVRNQNSLGALSAADKAVAADAASALAHEARGEALLALGREAEAETEQRKAIELDPQFALAQTQLALTLIALERPADALAMAKQATETDAKLGEAFAALGLALIAVDAQKNWGEAIAQAQTGATLLDPENPIVLTTVAKIFEVSGQIDQAARAYGRAVKADPAYGPARFGLVQAEMNRGDRDAALAAAQEAERSGMTFPQISLLLGEDAVRRNDHEEAIPHLEKAAEGLQTNADAWALLGIAYRARARFEDAGDALKKAVELAPDKVDYRATYGLILGQAGDLEGGLAQLQQVTSTPGYQDAAGWANLGWIYREMDRPQDSITAYQKALELDPKEWQAALGLGWAYSFTKDYDKAIAAYNRAIQINPQAAGPDANLGLAWSYLFKLQAPEAEAYSAKAAAGGRNVAALNENIAKLKQGLADFEQAEEDRKKTEELAKKIDRAMRALNSKTPANRSRGCREIVTIVGRNATATLVQLIQNDPNYDVRITCTEALGSLGAGARSAVPNLRALIGQDPYVAPVVGATKEQLDAELKDGDFRRALRDALQKIQ